MSKKCFWIPTILIMIGIFCFSSQTAEVSGDLSGEISYQVAQLTTEILDQDYSQEETLQLAAKIDYPIRKIAHFTEYTLLGIALGLGVLYGSNWFRNNRKKQYLLVQFIGSLYAFSDEFHQLFVSGRAGRTGDVLIDSLGVLAGWCIFILAVKLVTRKKYRL